MARAGEIVGVEMVDHMIVGAGGTIECVVTDQLRPGIKCLEAASRVTAEELREQHREQQALLKRLRGRLEDKIV